MRHLFVTALIHIKEAMIVSVVARVQRMPLLPVSSSTGIDSA